MATKMKMKTKTKKENKDNDSVDHKLESAVTVENLVSSNSGLYYNCEADSNDLEEKLAILSVISLSLQVQRRPTLVQ